MEIAILIGSFTIVCLLGMPVAYALGLAAILAALWVGIPLEAVMLKVSGGMSGFSLLAIPFFILAGAIMAVGGMAERLVNLAKVFVGFIRGGMALVNILASTMFGCISGSSVADTAAVGSVMIPQMIKNGYPRLFAVNVTISGSLQPLLVPPSHNMIIYSVAAGGTISVAHLFMGGIIPALLLGLSLIILVLIIAHRNNFPKGEVVPLRKALKIALDAVWGMITIAIIGWVKPGFLPAGRPTPWNERLAALKDIWAPLLLFIFVIGGLYGLPFLPRFTPTEAGGVGASGAFLIGVLSGRLNKDGILTSLLQATRTAAAVFTVLIGALLFGYFLTITQTPQKVTEFLTALGLGKYGVLALIMVMYLLLGCLMDAMAMIILTIPIIFPVITHLGFDPIWFGVIIVMTVELGLIHPPVGMNVFVIKSVIKDVSFTTIFKGVIPFIITDLIRLVILIAFPILALWLPSRM